MKLKKDDIEGLILDLRDNGGGSIEEAISLVGQFIDYGSTSIYDARDAEPTLLKDMARGKIFTKEMVVLVNQESASASELFAGAMQDYNRAVVIGEQTFGKSTAQIIVPVDIEGRDLYTDDMLSDIGYLKITNGHFYNNKGGTHQGVGIIPDVVLASIDDPYSISEEDFGNALPSRTIDKESYIRPMAELPIGELNHRSEQRLSSNLFFGAVSKVDSIFKADGGLTFPLRLDSFIAFMKERDFDRSQLNEENTVKVLNPSYILDTMFHSESEKESNEDKRTKISEDPYIVESYRIINDLLELN